MALLFDVKNGYSSDVGAKYKSTTGWNDNGNGTDEYGFAVFPSGYRYIYNGGGVRVTYAQKNWEAYLWMSSFYSSGSKYARYMDLYASNHRTNIYSTSEATSAYSIRCFKDKP